MAIRTTEALRQRLNYIIAEGEVRDLPRALERVRQRLAAAERRYGRPAGSVRLLAVGKTQPAARIRRAVKCGLREFAENYAQEAIIKLEELHGLEESGLTWHFIGALQANKTRPVASRFAWLHSLTRARVAQRLSAQRPDCLPPMNICLQVNIDGEAGKPGISDAAALAALARCVRELPRLRLRGLMAMPRPDTLNLRAQRAPFRRLRECAARLQDDLGIALDTLSMGTSRDLEAAVAEGATMVRVGTDIFGGRRS